MGGERAHAHARQEGRGGGGVRACDGHESAHAHARTHTCVHTNLLQKGGEGSRGVCGGAGGSGCNHVLEVR